VIESRSPGRQLGLLALAMVLGMTPWFSATVAAPGMIAEWKSGSGTAAWLTIAVQLGFVLGTLVSAALLLSDRFSPRVLAAVSSAIVGVATVSLIWRVSGPNTGLTLRLITGVALAGVYPPGIKIAAGWWRDRRGTAIGILVGALTIGSALPNLLRAAFTTTNWRPVVIASAVAAFAASLLFATAIQEGPYQASSAPFHPRVLSNVVRDRGVMLATAGYLGHMWELYAMWSSIGAFWTYAVTKHGVAPGTAPVLAFATIAAGMIGCVVAGMVADRVDRPIVTVVAMAISGVCAIAIGFMITAPIYVLAIVAILWGISIVADSAQFSALVTELAPAQYIGTAITLQTCVGFLLTIVTIRLVPVWAGRWGWEFAYVPLAIGPALGILSMLRLRHMPRAR